MNAAPLQTPEEPSLSDSKLRVEPNKTARRRALFVEQRIRWSLTWRGWLALLLTATLTGIGALRSIHPFLALNQPTHAKVLVIEGWIPDYAIARFAIPIKSGDYDQVITVGGPVAGVSSPAATDDTRAYVAAKVLARHGVDPARIRLVPTHTVSRDRTFHSASALRRWFEENHMEPKAIDVVTLGVHARRTRLLFAQALGNKIEVGVIAAPNEEYDPQHWWRYSEGIKEVISETAGYLYAKLLFRP